MYALAQLEYATAPQVAVKLAGFDPHTDIAVHQQNAQTILSALFKKGLIKGNDEPERQYNLSKILTQNSGKADNLF